MKKSILIFSLAYYPFVGGAEVAWKEITDRIEDFEFDMIVAKMNRTLSSYEKIGNIHVHRIGIGNALFDKILYCLLAPVKAYILHKKRKYIAHIGLMASYGGLASVFFQKIVPNIPYILNLQDGDTDDYIANKTRYIRPLYRKIFSNANIITPIATFLETRARDNGFKGKTFLIPNGVDVSKFINYQRREEKIQELRVKLGYGSSDKIIITTSRLNYKNAINDIILSLNYLDENFVFLCLGEGEERKNLEKLIEENNLSSRVNLFGYVDHSEMLDYLSLGNYFCRPSLQEGLGNSFLEAMAFSLPVVATPVGGIVDFLRDGETGYFCGVQNPESIAKAILKFDNDESRTRQIVEKAKEIVVENYSWDKHAKDYTTLFVSL